MAEPSPTEAAYHRDPYRTEAEVWVDALGVDERFGQYLVLSESLCHPHGGGQKGDRARLVLDEETARALALPPEADRIAAPEADRIAAPGPDGAGSPALQLVDTRRTERGTLHILAGALEEEQAREVLVGAKEFRLVLDWDFRYRQMRLHSLAHLLHCFIERILGRAVPFPETSDIQPEHGLNRYEVKELLNEEQAAEVVRQLNAFTAEGHPIETYPDEHKEGFRHWRCGEWTIPCGGTHPKATAEIGTAQAKLSLKRGRTSLIFSVTE